MATHSSILAWRIPWTEELGRTTVYGITKSGTRLKQLTLSLSHLGHHRAPNVTFKDAPKLFFTSTIGEFQLLHIFTDIFYHHFDFNPSHA